MCYLVREAITQLRNELNDLRKQVLSDRKIVSEQNESLGSSWENLIVEKDFKEKELVESMKKEYEIAVNDLKRIEEEKNTRIQNLLLEKNVLEAEVLKSCENLNELQEILNKVKEENETKVQELLDQLQEKEVEKEKLLKETTDRLNREHAVELQNIRSRFKLMTMERSPTEPSSEWSSQYTSSQLLAQMKENFEMDKEKAVTAAIQQETQKWENLLTERLDEMNQQFLQEKEKLLQDAVRQISEEKDREIELLLERERNLTEECTRYKNTIERLSESERQSDLLDRIDALQKEKERLEAELEKVKAERAADLTSSVAVCEGKPKNRLLLMIVGRFAFVGRDATTSPIRQREAMSRSEVSPARAGRVNVDSCKVGDLVVVLWDPSHESFKILQETRHMYFLHSDYLDVLGLEVADGKPNKLYCTGEVVDKEYCHARKVSTDISFSNAIRNYPLLKSHLTFIPFFLLSIQFSTH